MPVPPLAAVTANSMALTWRSGRSPPVGPQAKPIWRFFVRSSSHAAGKARSRRTYQ